MDTPSKLLNLNARRAIPILLQNEMAECGLACLAMLASYHGYRTDLAALRRRFQVGLQGLTLAQLMDMAHSLSFSARPLRLEPSEMQELRTPCILHWELNHFVVLVSVGRDGIVVHDPARGRRKLSWSEVDLGFTGVALELSPAPGFVRKDETTRLGFRQLWSRVEGLGNNLASLLSLSLVLQVIAIAAPFFLQLVVDEVIVGHDTDLLFVLAAGFSLLMLVQIGVTSLRALVILHFSNQFSIQIAANLFKHLLRLPQGWFERRHIGDIASRFSSLEFIRQQMTTGVVETLVDGIMMIGTLIMMAIYSPYLSAVVFLAVILYALVRLGMYLPAQASANEQLVASAKRDSNFIETVRNIQSIKLFGREAQREAIWQNHLANALNAGIRLGRLGVGWMAGNQLLFGIEHIAVVCLGAAAVMDGRLTVGMLFAFLAYKAQFSQQASGLIDKYVQFRFVGLHLNRVADIALSAPERHLGSAERSDRIEGNIELRQVSFRHTDATPPLFHALEVNIRSGESVAIVGPSGCGKTTLMKLMLGLLEPNQGEITVDGMDLRQFGLTAFRRQVATVMQDDGLLTGSMADNIAFFAETQDQALLERCAQLACIHEDITRMPMGYHTLIGEMGNTLSGGQRQRVLLARALYRQPRILFLDEATAHLDVTTEEAINRAVRALNVTRIVIAHRPETIAMADRVLKLEAGRIIEQKKSQDISLPALERLSLPQADRALTPIESS